MRGSSVPTSCRNSSMSKSRLYTFLHSEPSSPSLPSNVKANRTRSTSFQRLNEEVATGPFGIVRQSRYFLDPFRGSIATGKFRLQRHRSFLRHFCPQTHKDSCANAVLSNATIILDFHLYSVLDDTQVCLLR